MQKKQKKSPILSSVSSTDKRAFLSKSDKNLCSYIGSICSFPDQNPQPVLSVSQIGTLLYSNPAAKVILDAWNTDIGGLVPAYIKRIVQKALTLNNPQKIELEIYGRIYLINFSPFVTKKYTNIYFTNISDLKKTEDALRSREDMFHSIFENAIQGIVMADVKTKKFMMANQAICRLLGYTKKEMLKLGIPDIHPKQNIPSVMNSLKNLLSGKIKVAEAIECKKRDGSIIYADITISTFNIDGKPLVAGFFRDITQKKRAEYLKNVSELRYRRLFETAQDGILILNYETGKIIDVNPFLTCLLGFPKTKFINKQLWELGFFKDIAENKINSLKLKKKKYIRYEDLPLETADGRKIDVEFVSNVYNVDGQKVIQCNIRDITDRKKAEEELKVISSRQKSVLGAIPEILMEVNKNKIYSWANPAGYDFFGEDVIGKPASYYFEGEQKTYEAVKHIFTGKKKLIYVESWQRRKDGEKRLLAWWCTTLKDNYGKVIGALSSARDITEQNKSENDLLLKNALLNAQNEASIEGVLAIDPSGKMISHNSHFTEMWNIPASIIRTGDDKKLLACVLKQLKYPNIFLKDVQKLYKQTTKISNDEIEFKDGRIFNRYTSPLNDYFGHHLGRIWFFRDITESKNYERRIKASEERYRGIFDSSRDAILTMEPPDWHFTSANPAALNMLGCKNMKECLSGKLDKFSPKFQPNGQPSSVGLKAMIEKAMKEGSALFEWTNKKITGEEFPASVLFNKVTVGEKTFLQATARDITRQKKIEQAKMELISLASHQLRTPPTGVKWYTSMLLSQDVGTINSKQKAYLNEIMHNNQKMIDLVHSLLSASRIELGKFTPEPARTPIAKMLDDVISELSPQIINKKLQITKYHESNMLYATVDPSHLRIILFNVINNAVQYTPDNGKIKITLKKDGHFISIQVTDTGCGIPSNQQSQIFSQFFRANNAIEKHANGSGLGLYIVKLLVNSMGGRIEFESKLKKGTTFFISIPVKSKIKNLF